MGNGLCPQKPYPGINSPGEESQTSRQMGETALSYSNKVVVSRYRNRSSTAATHFPAWMNRSNIQNLRQREPRRNDSSHIGIDDLQRCPLTSQIDSDHHRGAFVDVQRHVFSSRSALAPGSCGRNLQNRMLASSGRSSENKTFLQTWRCPINRTDRRNAHRVFYFEPLA